MAGHSGTQAQEGEADPWDVMPENTQEEAASVGG